jgi:hypothetical protein
MKMRRKFDYTKWKVGLRIYDGEKTRIEVCPKCGKNGRPRRYSDGTACFFHKVELNPFGMLDITQSCMIGVDDE